MSRNTEYQFVDTNTDALVASMVSMYEAITGISVQPASPEKIFIEWVASIILQERVINNYTGNQNIPSRAEGANLDALGELFYALERPQAKAAKTTVRFNISAAQSGAVLIPSGTRVTDTGSTLFWATTEDHYIAAGSTYADIVVTCQTAGELGNGYAAGQINTIVDVYDYYSSCASITESDGGSDAATDDEYYEAMRQSMDAYSTAGAKGSYIYHAKAVSNIISDVVVNSPSAGTVKIYAIEEDDSTNGHKIATSTLKAAILAACNADSVRPLTDSVSTADPDTVSYNITFTYYRKSSSTKTALEIASEVNSAVNQYVSWQSAKLGRDINPSQLISLIMGIEGINRVALTYPAFTALDDGSTGTVPDMASVGTITKTDGGTEDD